MMLRKSIQTNCLFEEGDNRRGRAGDPRHCRILEASAESEPCPVDGSFELTRKMSGPPHSGWMLGGRTLLH